MSNVSDSLNYAKSHAGKAYRSDIDGLRAIAVMAVVIYHLKADALPGGFIGVDIFFVISGYLITGILAHNFVRHTFSLADFYQRRARRIFPALILVLALCLLVGWFFLFPSEYASLGKHVAAGAGFVENLMLWSETGYFDTESILKPLLHLWSLAVEEQFYIFWPLILWVILRRKLPLMSSIAIIGLASFVLNILSVWQGHAETSFYMPYTRAWELMVGAWLMVAHRQGVKAPERFANLLSWLGLSLLLLGFVLIRPEYSFPGFWALLPVAGAALLIYAGPTAYLNQRCLSARVMVWVGLISYPLYLWHWVLWSLGSIIFYSALDHSHHTVRIIRGVVLVLSFLFAWLTYRWLELPVRGHAKVKSAVVLASLVALLGVGGWSIYWQKGFPDRPGALFDIKAEKLAESVVFSPLVEKCHNLAENKAHDAEPTCVLGNTSADTSILVYGDSHAMALIPAFHKYGVERHIKVVFASQNGCPPIQGVYLKDSDYWLPCQRMIRAVNDLVRKQTFKLVVIVSRWTEHTGSLTRPDEYRPIFAASNDGKELEGMAAFKFGLTQTLAAYHSLRMPVVLLEDSPQQVHYLRIDSAIRFHASATLTSLEAGAVSFSEHKRNQAEVNRLLEKAVANYPEDSVLNMDAALCNTNVCPWTKDGRILYKDDDHLSVAGASEVYPLLAQQLDLVIGHKHKQP